MNKKFNMVISYQIAVSEEAVLTATLSQVGDMSTDRSLKTSI